MSLRSEELYGCEPATHLLLAALGGPTRDVRVRVGPGVVELAVEDGRLTQITVTSASGVLQDDVLFEGRHREDEDEPF